MRRIEINLKMFGITAHRSEYSIDRHIDEHMGKLLVHQLCTHIAAERQDPYGWDEPTSWWQMFKRDVFPAWLRNRFPVRNTRRVVTVDTVYPFLKTQIPKDLQGPRVTVLLNGKPAGSFFTDIDNVCMTPQRWNEEVVPELFKNQRCDSMGMSCPTCHRNIKHE